MIHENKIILQSSHDHESCPYACQRKLEENFLALLIIMFVIKALHLPIDALPISLTKH